MSEAPFEWTVGWAFVCLGLFVGVRILPAPYWRWLARLFLLGLGMVGSLIYQRTTNHYYYPAELEPIFKVVDITDQVIDLISRPLEMYSQAFFNTSSGGIAAILDSTGFSVTGYDRVFPVQGESFIRGPHVDLGTSVASTVDDFCLVHGDFLPQEQGEPRRPDSGLGEHQVAVTTAVILPLRFSQSVGSSIRLYAKPSTPRNPTMLHFLCKGPLPICAALWHAGASAS